MTKDGRPRTARRLLRREVVQTSYRRYHLSMTSRKERLTVTVDPALIAAGNDAVAEGRAESLSAWVNAALAERVAKERALAALAEAVTAYEEQFGEISADELADQSRADRETAVVVRGPAMTKKRKARSRKN